LRKKKAVKSARTNRIPARTGREKKAARPLRIRRGIKNRYASLAIRPLSWTGVIE
jgi:hypothetical protein